MGFVLVQKWNQEFTLINENYTRLVLPTHLFTCLKLTHLELFRCDLWHTYGFRGFPNLLSLDLFQVGFKRFKCGELLTQSPLLDTLKLTYNNTRDKI